MKRTAYPFFLAALATAAHGQTTTMVSDPNDLAITTVYYSICPTAVSTTITLPSTLTFCPGANCHGGPAPAITAAPAAGGLGTEIINYTTVGPDGSTTVYQEFETVYSQINPTGGLSPQTFTITEVCPCQTAHPTSYIPAGFSTTVYQCDVCAENGGATTITLTTPCSTGPYASQTPGAVWTASGAPAGGVASGGMTNSAGATGGGVGATASMAPAVTGSMTGAAGYTPSVAYNYQTSTGMASPTTGTMASTTGAMPSTFTGAGDRIGMTLSMVMAAVVAVVAWTL